MALVYGDVEGEDALTRVHSECLTGDAFGSRHCECGDQLSAALRAIVSEGRGILVYLQGHEGRGIGLLAKLQAMQLQAEGLDTVEANLALGLPVDARDYRVAAEMLHDLGRAVRTAAVEQPAQAGGAAAHGIKVSEQVPLLIAAVRGEHLPTCGPSGSGWTTTCRIWTVCCRPSTAAPSGPEQRGEPVAPTTRRACRTVGAPEALRREQAISAHMSDDVKHGRGDHAPGGRYGPPAHRRHPDDAAGRAARAAWDHRPQEGL